MNSLGLQLAERRFTRLGKPEEGCVRAELHIHCDLCGLQTRLRWDHPPVKGIPEAHAVYIAKHRADIAASHAMLHLQELGCQPVQCAMAASRILLRWSRCTILHLVILLREDGPTPAVAVAGTDRVGEDESVSDIAARAWRESREAQTPLERVEPPPVASPESDEPPGLVH